MLQSAMAMLVSSPTCFKESELSGEPLGILLHCTGSMPALLHASSLSCFQASTTRSSDQPVEEGGGRGDKEVGRWRRESGGTQGFQHWTVREQFNP